MYVCGTYLVMLASPPGVSGSSATRSLFGGTSGLSSLKSKSDTDDITAFFLYHLSLLYSLYHVIGDVLI